MRSNVAKELEFYINPLPNVFKGVQAPFKDSLFVIMGVPFDLTSTYRAGARFAPNAVREASINLEGFSLRGRMDVEDVKTHDLGDVDVVPSSINETLRRVEVVVRKVREAGKIPFLIGGEHTLTYGALMGTGRAALLCFDAHLDLRNEYPRGVEMSHATFMRRLAEAYGHDAVTIVGVRGVSKEEVDYAERKEVRFVTSLDVEELGPIEIARRIRSYLEAFDRVYVSIDLDVLDPAYAPGVGNPEPEGLKLSSLLNILNLVLDGRVVGVDVTEVCPPFDNGQAAIHAAKILFEEMIYLSRVFKLR